MTTFQIVISIINLVAVIVAPIAAVLITQRLQDRAELRKDKIQIFKTLVTIRGLGWNLDSVHALNVLDVVFADDGEVRNAWKDLYDKYCVDNPDEQQKKKIEQAQYKLLETIAVSLGYQSKITWETIQNPYIPKGMVDQIVMQSRSQQAYLAAINGFNAMVQSQSHQPKADR